MQFLLTPLFPITLDVYTVFPVVFFFHALHSRSYLFCIVNIILCAKEDSDSIYLDP